eukprot:TRINITY_DN3192_c0_g1_i3.p1 TRINITY_DN3192_c0_g1~~TRINITY_DN3192_c0_g1_i3.p1  ORF type:complete len:763 (-),score=197.21 TRINITY_DN3192_c0_g1_i3:19-2307(-)
MDMARVVNEIESFVDEMKDSPDIILRGKAHLCHGNYLRKVYQLSDEWNDATFTNVLRSFEESLACNPSSSKSWRAFALSNHEAIAYYEHYDGKISPNIQSHATAAINALFKAVSLSRVQALQDVLRLLTLYFKFASSPDSPVEATFRSCFPTVDVSTWMLVIPQLIARMHSPLPNQRRLVKDVLCQLGIAHPQALVYPLSVAAKSSAQLRRATAQIVLDEMRNHSSKLVDQALLVSRELIRVSILWMELWRVKLEEASRYCYSEDNFMGMMTVLRTLYEMIEKGGETASEIDFVKRYEQELLEAYTYVKGQPSRADIDKAWHKYGQIYEDLGVKLQEITSVNLSEISPRLSSTKSFELAVPGSYRHTAPVITIKEIVELIPIIPSKQRPRKLDIIGSDGKNYRFLLKGHEDLRQDERVMQFFSLVNSLLKSKQGIAKDNLKIGTFDVVPLSSNSGLISWVMESDTLHELIKQHREKKGIVLNLEHRLMEDFSGGFFNQSHILQKLESFQNSLASSSSSDLASIIWEKSPSSEEWLERRLNFTKSTALMSMVGYILGLGDRHPSNLLVIRNSGIVVHIDFGDCFEVAMSRDKFPESVPFRLTRMMIKAMGVTGIAGVYRLTCEKVLQLLRESKDSLMAVLEAFVHDPLINWRLMNNNTDNAFTQAKREFSPSLQELRGIITDYDISGSGDGSIIGGSGDQTDNEEMFNQRALSVLMRVNRKLTGRDFGNGAPLDTPTQVEQLIKQATSHENLCQSYVGWCPFW